LNDKLLKDYTYRYYFVEKQRLRENSLEHVGTSMTKKNREFLFMKEKERLFGKRDKTE